jgi:hypothetical protein
MHGTLEMFTNTNNFFSFLKKSEKHSGKVKTLFFDLLIPILNETDQISNKLMEIIFTKVIEPQKVYLGHRPKHDCTILYTYYYLCVVEKEQQQRSLQFGIEFDQEVRRTL